MAVDNFNRTDSVNAIVEAWTQFHSLPFITNKTVSSNSSATFNISAPFKGLCLCYGTAANDNGLFMINKTGGGAASLKAITQPANVTASFVSAQFKITTSGTSSILYIIALNGSCEEV